MSKIVLCSIGGLSIAFGVSTIGISAGVPIGPAIAAAVLLIAGVILIASAYSK